MSFNFSQLRIEKGPTLARETNRVVELFKLLQKTTEATDASKEEQEEARTMLETLYTRIQNRIEELEDFYVEHDADDRSLLFESQRMALRRLLHAYCISVESKQRQVSQSSSSQNVPPATTDSKKRSAKSDKPGKRKPVKGATPSRNAEHKPSNQKKKSSKTRRSAKPIYNWEKNSTSDEIESEAVPLDPYEQPELDFDIVLTEQEFFAYTSRLREYSVSQRAKKVINE